jgi:hypothetical protein
LSRAAAEHPLLPRRVRPAQQADDPPAGAPGQAHPSTLAGIAKQRLASTATRHNQDLVQLSAMQSLKYESVLAGPVTVRVRERSEETPEEAGGGVPHAALPGASATLCGRAIVHSLKKPYDAVVSALGCQICVRRVSTTK